MRTIKFRGKRLNNGEWVYGSLTQSETHNKNGEPFMVSYIAPFIPVGSECGFELVKMDRVVPATVGQFTGLHDKNGTPIYERDIIKWYEIGHSDHDILEPPEDYIKECMDGVEFIGGTFCVGRDEAPSDIPVEFLTKEWQANEDDMFKWVYNTDEYPNITIDDMYICEVIGNIHDNPDLIEKGGEQ